MFEVVDDDDGDTYRAVYTVRLRHHVYVIHCFQKKSTTGIATPLREIELIRRRLVAAQEYDDDLTQRGVPVRAEGEVQ